MIKVIRRGAVSPDLVDIPCGSIFSFNDESDEWDWYTDDIFIKTNSSTFVNLRNGNLYVIDEENEDEEVTVYKDVEIHIVD